MAFITPLTHNLYTTLSQYLSQKKVIGKGCKNRSGSLRNRRIIYQTYQYTFYPAKLDHPFAVRCVGSSCIPSWCAFLTICIAILEGLLGKHKKSLYFLWLTEQSEHLKRYVAKKKPSYLCKLKNKKNDIAEVLSCSFMSLAWRTPRISRNVKQNLQEQTLSSQSGKYIQVLAPDPWKHQTPGL